MQETNSELKNLKLTKNLEKRFTKLETYSKNFNKLKKDRKKIIGYGAPAKATTALNFYGISDQIDFIVEDNSLKHNKFIPEVKIPIKSKKIIKNNNNTMVVLAWNFFNDIKKNNTNLSKNFINIKDLEKKYKFNASLKSIIKLSKFSNKYSIYISVNGSFSIMMFFVRFNIPINIKTVIISIVK